MDASTGISLGGAGVDEFGAWLPAIPQTQRVAAGREIGLDIPAASAALVSMHV
jgi:hypothetical protein